MKPTNMSVQEKLFHFDKQGNQLQPCLLLSGVLWAYNQINSLQDDITVKRIYFSWNYTCACLLSNVFHAYFERQLFLSFICALSTPNYVLHALATMSISQNSLLLKVKIHVSILDETKCTPAKQSPGVASTPAESCLRLIRPDLSPDLRVWNSWGSNEGSEPQLTLQEGVFTFSSQPHSPKRGQGRGDMGKMETADDQLHSRNGRRYHPQPEDDFIGSESDEVCLLQVRDAALWTRKHLKCILCCQDTNDHVLSMRATTLLCHIQCFVKVTISKLQQSDFFSAAFFWLYIVL